MVGEPAPPASCSPRGVQASLLAAVAGRGGRLPLAVAPGLHHPHHLVRHHPVTGWEQVDWIQHDQEISTYSDLNPRDSRNQMMCHWSSQITSDCAERLVSPPLPFSSSPFSYPCPYHRPVCYPAHGHTGVFQNNFLWHKLLALVCTFFAFLSSHYFFPVHFRNIPCRKNVHSFSARQWSKKSFFPLFPLLQFFIFLNEPCQLQYLYRRN